MEPDYGSQEDHRNKWKSGEFWRDLPFHRPFQQNGRHLSPWVIPYLWRDFRCIDESRTASSFPPAKTVRKLPKNGEATAAEGTLPKRSRIQKQSSRWLYLLKFNAWTKMNLSGKPYFHRRSLCKSMLHEWPSYSVRYVAQNMWFYQSKIFPLPSG